MVSQSAIHDSCGKLAKLYPGGQILVPGVSSNHYTPLNFARPHHIPWLCRLPQSTASSRPLPAAFPSGTVSFYMVNHIWLYSVPVPPPPPVIPLFSTVSLVFRQLLNLPLYSPLYSLLYSPPPYINPVHALIIVKAAT